MSKTQNGQNEQRQRETANNHSSVSTFPPQDVFGHPHFSPFIIRGCRKNVWKTNLTSSAPLLTALSFSIEAQETRSRKVCLLRLQTLCSPFPSSPGRLSGKMQKGSAGKCAVVFDGEQPAHAWLRTLVLRRPCGWMMSRHAQPPTQPLGS